MYLPSSFTSLFFYPLSYLHLSFCFYFFNFELLGNTREIVVIKRTCKGMSITKVSSFLFFFSFFYLSISFFAFIFIYFFCISFFSSCFSSFSLIFLISSRQ